MKRVIVRLCLGLLIVVLCVAAVFAVSPGARTRAFIATYRVWDFHLPFAGGKTVADRLTGSYCPFVPIQVELEPSMTMTLDPCDLVTREILLHHTWEPETTKVVASHLRAGGTFVDVGAHVGWYTLKAAQLVGPKGHVIAVEPNPETLVRLFDNVRSSGVGGIVVVAPVASSDSEGTLTLYAAPRENTGESSLASGNAAQGGGTAVPYQVRARRLDDIVREAHVGPVDMIKIDVEGAEFTVLKGAVETLDRDRPVLSVELLDPQLKQMGSSVAEVQAFLSAHGYVPTVQREDNTIFLPVTARKP